ncbi:MAG: ribosome silencing factor [Alphaproteobacteria bacterium]|nr:ribosome silencing factor [Alphaproteobacteria bacterium]
MLNGRAYALPHSTPLKDALVATKKTATKKKAAPQKKTASAKKAAPKKTVKPAAKKVTAKKPAAKKPAAKKPVAKKAAAKKIVAKKAITKKSAATRVTAKVATKKVIAKKPAAKKVTAKKPVAPKPAAPTPVIKKPAGLPEQLLSAALKVLDERQAEEIVTVDLTGRSTMADYVVIASGRASRQIGAIAHYLAQAFALLGVRNTRVEGASEGNWVLVDAGDIIIHLFRPEVRAYYDLEQLWTKKGNARDVAVPEAAAVDASPTHEEDVA